MLSDSYKQIFLVPKRDFFEDKLGKEGGKFHYSDKTLFLSSSTIFSQQNTQNVSFKKPPAFSGV